MEEGLVWEDEEIDIPSILEVVVMMLLPMMLRT
jgi:hypothetical protein